MGFLNENQRNMARQPFYASIGDRAPLFQAQAVSGDNMLTRLQLADYKGKWLILFFYPSNFTFV